jgi:porin
MKPLSLLRILAPTILAGSLAISTSSAEGIKPPESDKSQMMQWLEGDYLLGTWNGLRTDLKDQGVDFEFFYFGSLPSNVDGGIETGTVYQGALLTTLEVKSDKLFGYEGGKFYASTVWLHGEDNFSNNHIGDFNKVNLTDFDNMFRLWELWYSQKLASDKLTIKAGVMSVDRDFIVPEYYNSIASINFLNQTFFYPTLAFNLFDIPGFPAGNHLLPSTPYGALGMLIRVDPSESFYVQAAAYDGNPATEGHGLDFRLASEEGALIYAETGVRWNTAATSNGLPGSVKLGGYYHTDEFYDVYQGVQALFGVTGDLPEEHGGNFGGYLLAEQYLWLENDRSDPAMQGAIGFFRVAAAPKDRNLTQFGIDGGVVFKGLFPGRDWDTLSLGLSYLRISDDIRDSFRDINSLAGTDLPLPDYEGVIELSYKAQLTAWWTLQPSLQWAIHPGGRTDPERQPEDAIAFILQTTLRF